MSGKRRVSYVIVGTGEHGWRDLHDDRGVSVQIDETVHMCRAGDLATGDLARGIRDGRSATGAPVRILRVRPLP